VQLIVVAGASGLQGGATARRLLRDGFRVRGLTRTPAGRTSNIDWVQADFNDRASLDRACAGAHGVFIMATPFGKGATVDAEEQHAKNLVDAAKANGVQHVVYSSVGGAERKSGVPHFENKFRVEQYIRELGLRATILRPAVFMDMLANAPLPMRMVLYAALTAEMGTQKQLQLVAVDDIAAFASMAFRRPDEFVGRALELAGDSLSIPDLARAFRRATGKRFGWMALPRALVRRMPAEMSLMMRWFAEHGFQADIATLRSMHPELITFERMLRSR
jgi:uncharacterized protein YbjT (DUF2867 family)